MSIEVIPKDFREPYDPFSEVDHGLVRDYTRYRLLGSGDIVANLQSRYDMNANRFPDFLRRLIERGKFLEPVNDELEFIDKEMTNMRVFNAGVALACTALDSLAYEMSVDGREWRQRWTDLPVESDFPRIEGSGETLSPEDCLKIGDRLIANGQQAYESLEPPYQELFQEAGEAYPGALTNEQVLRSSYGYVLRFGEKVICSFSLESRLDSAVEEVISKADVDNEIINLVSKRERRNLRKSIREPRRR